MTEETEVKQHENVYKFGLYHDGQPVVEKIFSADNYNPVVRYRVDIREKISSIISRLTKTLQSRTLNYNIYGNKFSYNNLDIYKKMLKSDPPKQYGETVVRVQKNKLESPKLKPFLRKGGTQEFYGVEFKIALSINDKLIVERYFGVEDYNPSSRFSKEIVDVVNWIVEDIQTHLTNVDRNHMADDSDIIKIYGLNISQIRDLAPEKRKELLRKASDYEFVKMIKNEYRISSMNEIEEEV